MEITETEKKKKKPSHFSNLKSIWKFYFSKCKFKLKAQVPLENNCFFNFSLVQPSDAMLNLLLS